jgi:hypothetical protein
MKLVISPTTFEGMGTGNQIQMHRLTGVKLRTNLTGESARKSMVVHPWKRESLE